MPSLKPMRRGRTASLFQFMPEQPFNYERRQGTFKGNYDSNTADLDIPRGWIKQSLRELVEPFAQAASAAGTKFTGMSLIEKERFDLFEPKKLSGEFFPRTYLCPECHLFLQKSVGGKTIGCGCGGEAPQFNFVEFHQCGYLSGLRPPACDNNCKKGMRLVGTRSRSTGDWRWVCAGCGREASRGVYCGCGQCKSGRIAVVRADASQVFHSQHVVTVNPPTSGDYSVFASDTAYRAAVAQELGALPPGLDAVRDAVNSTDGATAVQKAKDMLQALGIPEGSPAYSDGLKNYLSKHSGASGWEKAVDDLKLSAEQINALGRRCAELTLAREKGTVTVDDLVEQDVSRASVPLYWEHEAVLRHYNFAEAVLLREFPLAYVVAGFTRQYSEPKMGVNFRFFKGDDGKVSMYGQKVETEALLFRLDPGAVVKWLVDSGVVADPGKVDPQAWVFSRTEGVNRFGTPQDRINAAVLGLVHTVSHKVISAIASRSGLAPESLSEHLFHQNLTFLIYADTRGSDSLGGLEYVFENHLGKSLKKLDEERRCVFDPPCNDGGGSCAICTHLSENSCQRFNADLSRHFIFGGEHEDVSWVPFWKD